MHFYRNYLYFYIGSLSFLSGMGAGGMNLYFMSSVIVSKEFSSVQTTTKIEAIIFPSVVCSLYI